MHTLDNIQREKLERFLLVLNEEASIYQSLLAIYRLEISQFNIGRPPNLTLLQYLIPLFKQAPLLKKTHGGNHYLIKLTASNFSLNSQQNNIIRQIDLALATIEIALPKKVLSAIDYESLRINTVDLLELLDQIQYSVTFKLQNLTELQISEMNLFIKDISIANYPILSADFIATLRKSIQSHQKSDAKQSAIKETREINQIMGQLIPKGIKPNKISLFVKDFTKLYFIESYRAYETSEQKKQQQLDAIFNSLTVSYESYRQLYDNFFN